MSKSELEKSVELIRTKKFKDSCLSELCDNLETWCFLNEARVGKDNVFFKYDVSSLKAKIIIRNYTTDINAQIKYKHSDQVIEEWVYIAVRRHVLIDIVNNEVTIRLKDLVFNDNSTVTNMMKNDYHLGFYSTFSLFRNLPGKAIEIKESKEEVIKSIQKDNIKIFEMFSEILEKGV